MPDRYDTTDNPEGQYQRGSDDHVLLNRLGISDVEEMDQAEFDALAELQDVLFVELDFALLENEKARYIAAIHAGHAGDNSAMAQIFSEILSFSLQQTLEND